MDFKRKSSLRLSAHLTMLITFLLAGIALLACPDKAYAAILCDLYGTEGMQCMQVPSNKAVSSTTSNEQSDANTMQVSNSGLPFPSYEKVLDAPFISQGKTMLCEGASLLQAMHCKDLTDQSLLEFVKSMPRSSDNNPYNGYSGEWRHNVSGTYQGMMAAPIVEWANTNGASASDITGAGCEGIKKAIRNGNPVVAWVTGRYVSPKYRQMPWGLAVWNCHVVTVDGIRDDAYHVVDPVAGAHWIDASAFEHAFNITGMAVEVS